MTPKQWTTWEDLGTALAGIHRRHHAQRYLLADAWLRHAAPTWQTTGATWSIVHLIDRDQLGNFFERLAEEKADHEDAAASWASTQLGDYRVRHADVFDDENTLWHRLYDSKYGELEALAYLPRLDSLATCIREGTPQIDTDPNVEKIFGPQTRLP